MEMYFPSAGSMRFLLCRSNRFGEDSAEGDNLSAGFVFFHRAMGLHHFVRKRI